MKPTPVLLSGNMCDARLWTEAVRATFPGAIDADLTRDDSIEAMAERALAATDGQLLPDEQHDGFFYATLEKTN